MEVWRVCCQCILGGRRLAGFGGFEGVLLGEYIYMPGGQRPRRKELGLEFWKFGGFAA